MNCTYNVKGYTIYVTYIRYIILCAALNKIHKSVPLCHICVQCLMYFCNLQTVCNGNNTVTLIKEMLVCEQYVYVTIRWYTLYLYLLICNSVGSNELPAYNIPKSHTSICNIPKVPIHELLQYRDLPITPMIFMRSVVIK